MCVSRRQLGARRCLHSTPGGLPWVLRHLQALDIEWQKLHQPQEHPGLHCVIHRRHVGPRRPVRTADNEWRQDRRPDERQPDPPVHRGLDGPPRVRQGTREIWRQP